MAESRATNNEPTYAPGMSRWFAESLTSAEQLSVTGYDEYYGTVVVLAGELDVASAHILTDYFAKLGARCNPHVVADVADLEFCDCVGLSALVRAHNRATAAGGWLRLSAATPRIRRLLYLTGLTRILACYPSVSAAFATPSVQPAG